MALQITGRIRSIGSTQSIPSKNGGTTLEKRELILDTTRFDPYTGERSKYENYPSLEFTGEKCKDLDGYQVGQVVTVTFELQGNFFMGQDGTEKNITRARAFKVEARAVQHTAQPQAPQPMAQPMAQPQQAPQWRPEDVPPPTQSNLPW